MRISVLSVFPETFDSFKATPVVRRAIAKGSVDFETVDIKDFAEGSFRKIDDSPCGGGPGMIIRIDTLSRALASVRTPNSHVVLLSPKGKTFNQAKAHELSKLDHLVMICGHYEGVDARIEDQIDEQISIGDYILTGGEFATMVVCDSVIRLLKGSLRDSSTVDESFETDLLEYPQYTHPISYEGKSVPEVLLCGDRKEIERWRFSQSLLETAKYRPDLLERKSFDCMTVGMSSSRVLMFDDMVMKISDIGDEERREYESLLWLDGKLPVPKVLGYVQNGSKAYLLLSKVKGKMLCDEAILKNENRLYKSVIAALRMLWSVDKSGCPLSGGLDSLLKKARLNVEKGLVDTSSSVFGPNGFASPTDLLTWLEQNRPKEDLVLSHGDLCLPNILANCDGITGLIDLGSCQVADLYRDIAICIRSLERNMAGLYGSVPCERPFDRAKFFELLGMKPDEAKIRYYTLLDELS